jgi:DNA-binding LacI/PurR family transcriptional regulator
LPRVSIASEASDGVPAIRLKDMHAKALDYLQSRGCKKVALLTGASAVANGELQIQWTQGAAARGMTVRPDWVQGLDIRFPQTAQNLVQLLMRGSAEDRPDGLLIGDDNLVEYATAGLIDSGVKVPSEIEVVAHCNFPWPTPSVLPIKRLGYDVRECLKECIAAIDKQRNKETLAPIVIPARLEEEVRLD